MSREATTIRGGGSTFILAKKTSYKNLFQFTRSHFFLKNKCTDFSSRHNVRLEAQLALYFSQSQDEILVFLFCFLPISPLSYSKQIRISFRTHIDAFRYFLWYLSLKFKPLSPPFSVTTLPTDIKNNQLTSFYSLTFQKQNV